MPESTTTPREFVDEIRREILAHPKPHPLPSDRMRAAIETSYGPYVAHEWTLHSIHGGYADWRALELAIESVERRSGTA